MRARHELLALGFPVLLCVAAWAMIVARPAARAHVAPQPHSRVDAPRPQRRPPSPAPHALPEDTDTPAETPAETAPAASETPAAASSGPVSTTDGRESSESIIIEGEWGCGLSYDEDWEDRWRWSPQGLAWSRRYFYQRRANEARWREWREARRRRVNAPLAPGSALAMAPGDDDLPSLCSVFGAACASATSAPPVVTVDRAAPVEPEPAVIRRAGRRWTLDNGLVEATIDPDALCALTLRRPARDATLPPLTFATPDDATCEVTETAAPDTDAAQGAVALSLTWRGNGWWQQAVVSLRDGAVSPEASVTRTTREGAAVSTELSNLTGRALTWTLDGRDHTVAPRGVARIRS